MYTYVYVVHNVGWCVSVCVLLNWFSATKEPMERRWDSMENWWGHVCLHVLVCSKCVRIHVRVCVGLPCWKLATGVHTLSVSLVFPLSTSFLLFFFSLPLYCFFCSSLPPLSLILSCFLIPPPSAYLVPPSLFLSLFPILSPFHSLSTPPIIPHPSSSPSPTPSLSHHHSPPLPPTLLSRSHSLTSLYSTSLPSLENLHRNGRPDR